MVTPSPDQELPKGPYSQKLVWFDCGFGHHYQVMWCNYASGRSTKCRRCRSSPFAVAAIQGKRFGALTYESGESVTSHSKPLWRCACGNLKALRVRHVTSGATVSCGACAARLSKFWNKPNPVRTSSGYSLEYLQDYFADSKITPLEAAARHTQRTRFHCELCGRNFTAKFAAVVVGKALSCGCVGGRVSTQNQAIFDYVATLTDDCEMEAKIGKRDFDVRVGNLLIEYHGAFWHSTPAAVKRDLSKKQAAVKAGFDLLIVEASDWKDQDKVKAEIARRFRRSAGCPPGCSGAGIH